MVVVMVWNRCTKQRGLGAHTKGKSCLIDSPIPAAAITANKRCTRTDIQHSQTVVVSGANSSSSIGSAAAVRIGELWCFFGQWASSRENVGIFRQARVNADCCAKKKFNATLHQYHTFRVVRVLNPHSYAWWLQVLKELLWVTTMREIVNRDSKSAAALALVALGKTWLFSA